MEKTFAIRTIWDYMHMEHELVPADLLFILGSLDVRVAKHTAALYHQGLAPLIAISGDGTQHETLLLRDQFNGHKEAEVLRTVCLEAGVPESAIIIETNANNTGQNFEYMTPILRERNLLPQTCIVVQKPYMERRSYATGKVWWPDVDLRLSSPSGTFDDYVTGHFDPDHVINIMVGDLERIREYPARGFQVHQDIPDTVTEAFETLVQLGYTKHLIGS